MDIRGGRTLHDFEFEKFWLHDERQIREIKAFCFAAQSGSVLAFDKTFNLGSIYVTPSVFKNTALTRKRTGVISPVISRSYFLAWTFRSTELRFVFFSFVSATHGLRPTGSDARIR